MATWDDGPGRLPDPDAPGLIPDDASALEPDRLAWLAEQGALKPHTSPRMSPRPAPVAVPPQQFRRGSGRHGMIFTRRWHQFGLSGPILALCLLVVGMVGVAAVTLITRPGPPAPASATLAPVAVARAPRPVGDSPPATVEPDVGPVIGHRLPGVALAADTHSVFSQALRPAVMVLLPAAGNTPSPQLYAGVVHEIYQQAREFRLPLWLIEDGDTDAARQSLIHLDETATSGGARWAVDAGGVLSTALAAHGPTMVAVRADGVLLGMRRDLPVDSATMPASEPLFARLAIPNR
jgi:hypothetical protein